MTVGISVTGANERSGALGVVPGSHRANMQTAMLDPKLDLEARKLEIEDVADYVMYLTDFGVVQRDVDYELDGEAYSSLSKEDYEEIRDEALLSAHEDGWPVSVGQETENDEDSIERGRVLYEAQCVACHGASGVGDVVRDRGEVADAMSVEPVGGYSALDHGGSHSFGAALRQSNVGVERPLIIRMAHDRHCHVRIVQQ